MRDRKVAAPIARARWLLDRGFLSAIGWQRRPLDVPSTCVSAVAIVSVAAVCAGYLCVERHQVRRAAQARFLERRRSGVLRWCEPGVSGELAASRTLERDIESVVRTADFAWSYYDRLFLCGAPGESPFQLRRARVDAAQRRFSAAARRLERAASSWLALAESEPSVDAQSRLAVTRMQSWLRDQPVPTRFPVGESADSLHATVDVLENALANLRQRRGRDLGADPFRHGEARQDVIDRAPPVPPRQADAVSSSVHT
jgi:hypothetical protein